MILVMILLPGSCRDRACFVENNRGTGVEVEPPREQCLGRVDRNAADLEPGRAELGLAGERGGCPQRRGLHPQQDDQRDDQHLADEELGRGHASLRPHATRGAGFGSIRGEAKRRASRTA
jgi:hypothetical protein